MKIETVHRKEFTRNNRIDSSYYLSTGAVAERIVKSFSEKNRCIQLGNSQIARVWQPNRNIMVYAGENEDYVPYLQPYDILEFLPTERSRLSSNQNKIDELKVTEGTILQTCSGRNLGPLVIADKYLEQFIFGSDLIRINVADNRTRNYVFAFFSTWIGQALLHSSKTGSVIDHLSINDVEKIKIPLVDEKNIDEIAELISGSIKAMATARNMISDLTTRFNAIINCPINNDKLARGWTTNFNSLSSTLRIDAAYYSPKATCAEKALMNVGGIRLSLVAEVFKPSGRYKTNYVEKAYGKPLVSGRQLLQNQIVGLQYLPNSSIDEFSKYRLKEGYIAYPADGRVEGRLGTPVYVTKNREDWYASGHIGRIKAHENINPGYLYLAMKHPAVQAQLYSLACGSVVDAVYPEDVENIIIPNYIEFPYDDVVSAWNLFDEADKLKEVACSKLSFLIEHANKKM